MALIFRAWKWNHDRTEKLYARDYGYRAWPIYIGNDPLQVRKVKTTL